jgi:hypothetical protein
MKRDVIQHDADGRPAAGYDRAVAEISPSLLGVQCDGDDFPPAHPCKKLNWHGSGSMEVKCAAATSVRTGESITLRFRLIGQNAHFRPHLFGPLMLALPHPFSSQSFTCFGVTTTKVDIRKECEFTVLCNRFCVPNSAGRVREAL